MRRWSAQLDGTPASIAEWLAENPSVALADFASVAGAAEVVVNATNGSATLAALAEAGAANLAGKVLLDVAVPLDFSKGFPPTLTVKDTDSLGEQVQRAFPETRVVKSLNTMNASVMANPGVLPEPTTVFLSGDDPDAKATVAAPARRVRLDRHPRPRRHHHRARPRDVVAPVASGDGRRRRSDVQPADRSLTVRTQDRAPGRVRRR